MCLRQRDVIEFTIRLANERYAGLDSGAVTIMLSSAALVLMKPADDVIVHFQVDNVADALAHTRRQGATVLLEPTSTYCGTESSMIKGRQGIVVALYGWVGPHPA